MQDLDLKELAESLPAVVMSSRVPATAKKYAGAFLRWKKWAVKPIPAKSIFVAILLESSKRTSIVMDHRLLLRVLAPGYVQWQ